MRSPAEPAMNCATRGSRDANASSAVPSKTICEVVRVSREERVQHHHPVGHLPTVRISCVTTMLVTGRGCRSLEDQSVDHVGHDRVEAGRRLVVEHHLRVERQRPGQARRASASRRTARPASSARRVAGSPTSCSRSRTRSAISVSVTRPSPQPERDVVEDRQAVEQRRPLEQEAEPQPLANSVRLLLAFRSPAGRPNRTSPRSAAQAHHQLHRHTLAATALADQRQSLAAPNASEISRSTV